MSKRWEFTPKSEIAEYIETLEGSRNAQGEVAFAVLKSVETILNGEKGDELLSVATYDTETFKELLTIRVLIKQLKGEY